MNKKEKRCKTCRWHYHEDIDDGHVCVNDRSDYCTDWTDDDFGCPEWEAQDD